MIPSRGLQWSGKAIGLGRRRIGVSSARDFSSSNVQYRPLRANPLLSNVTTSTFKSRANIRSSNTVQILRNGVGIRFASSTPTPSPIEAASSSAATTPADLSTSLDAFSSIDPQSILNMPEQIGYLKALGLEYGFGPTAAAQWLLEHIHVFTGTPWWISIGLTAVLVRVILLKPYIWAADTGTKMKAIKPLTEPLREKMKNASQANDVQAVLEARNELTRLHRRAGVSVWKAFMAPLGQGLLGFGTFFALRAMSKLPVPALETGGALWYTNLTIPDPYFLLPMMTATVGHYLFRLGGETGQSTMTPEMQKAFMYGFPLLTLLFTWWLPAAVQLSFFVTSVTGFLQAAALRNEGVRSLVGLSPKPASEAPAVLNPYKGNMKIAAPTPRAPARPAALSTSELNSRFQQPSNLSSTAGSAEPPVKATSTLLNKLKGQFSGVEEFRKDMIKKGKSSLESRLEKSNLKEKEAYEKKRREEIQTRRREEAQRRRAERAARKAKNDQY